jgi:coenzyme F420-dependent glucose-6-phosphate dehydrogenase
MNFSLGYRAVEEKWQPSRLLDLTLMAEKQGFDFVCTSDHFHPWFHEGGCAGHAWVWIGAAGARTKTIRLGTGVTTPSSRYHPAIIAQAFATLGEMFPGRIFLGLGTGEAMNEVPLGFKWPIFRERAERLEETIKIIKLLWKGDFVTYGGKHFTLRDARLYTLPSKSVPMYVAASGPTIAKMAGLYADAFMTLYTGSDAHLKTLASFREGAKNADRSYEEIPRMIETKISYDEDYDRALQSLSRWRSGLIPNIFSKQIYDPRELDRLGETVDIKKLADLVFTDMDSIVKLIEELVEDGFNEVQLGSSSPDEEKFIEEFGKKALPYLKKKYAEL